MEPLLHKNILDSIILHFRVNFYQYGVVITCKILSTIINILSLSYTLYIQDVIVQDSSQHIHILGNLKILQYFLTLSSKHCTQMNGAPCIVLKTFLNSHKDVIIQMQLHKQFSSIVPWIMLSNLDSRIWFYLKESMQNLAYKI